MYLVNNIHQIYHLLNKSKKFIFVYNNDRREYIILIATLVFIKKKAVMASNGS